MSGFPLANRHGVKHFATGDDRKIASRTSTARVVVFPYTKQNFGVASNTRGSFSSSRIMGIGDKETYEKTIELDGEIDSISISKNIRGPSGSFSINLFPTRNFKYLISPGDWLLIYLYHDDSTSGFQGETNNLVLCGNVDRVSRVKEKDEETDKTMLRYKVAGKNFGKVFENTDIWFDPYAKNEKVLDEVLRTKGLTLTGSPDSLVNSFVDVFLGPGSGVVGDSTSPLGQWKIPSELGSVLGGGSTFYGILDKKIEDGLPGYKARQMIGLGGNSNLWESIERASNSVVNEIFCEETRSSSGSVTLALVLRPRPYTSPFFNSQFGGSGLKGQLKGKHETLQELASRSFVEIHPAEIMYEDLGSDEHSRFNMIWCETRNFKNDTHSYYGNQKSSGVGLPMVLSESIQRHGLQRFEKTLEFVYANKGKTKEIESEVDLYRAFIVQIYDFYYANHLFEQGTMECTGVLEAEIGKCLKVKAEEGEIEKIYYIEGYEHNFSSLGKWTTSFTLTRGQFNDGNAPFIDQIADDFGEVDMVNDPYNLIKSRADRPGATSEGIAGTPGASRVFSKAASSIISRLS